MSVFDDSDCLDRVGSALAGMAGLAGAAGLAAGSVAVGGGLLAIACAGRAAMLGRLKNKESNADHVLELFIEQFKNSWQEWSGHSPSATRSPEDLESAAKCFEEYFIVDDMVRRLPSAHHANTGDERLADKGA